MDLRDPDDHLLADLEVSDGDAVRLVDAEDALAEERDPGEDEAALFLGDGDEDDCSAASNEDLPDLVTEARGRGDALETFDGLPRKRRCPSCGGLARFCWCGEVAAPRADAADDDDGELFA